MNSGLCDRSTPSLRKFLLISKTRGMPPTSRRFRYSSGAMRMKRVMSSVLWCVVKGAAAAPPAMGCSMGVSTSRYSCVSMNFLMACTILDRH